MNKWLLLLIPFLMGFKSNETLHDAPQKVTDEFRNVERTTQSKQWRVLSGTPTLTDLEDHEVVLVSSNGWTAIMFRDNVEVYSIRFSCVTVSR